MHTQPSLDMEDEANRFAAELLMPKDEIIKEFRKKITLGDLARLKKIWKVSMQSLLYRASSLGAISANQSSYLWRQISYHGYRKQEPISTQFPMETPTTLKDVISLHNKQLNYSINDMAKISNINIVDFNYLYQNYLNKEPNLRLVK